MECKILRWVAFFCRTRGVFEPVGRELPREAIVDPGVCLRVGWFSGVGQTIQEVGRCNCSPCLRNILFPMSVHPAFGVIGVLNMVALDLEELDVRDG